MCSSDSVSRGIDAPPTASNDETPEEPSAPASDMTTSTSGPSSEAELGLIPPPSDFMDRPEAPPQPQEGPGPSVTGGSLPDKPWSEAPPPPSEEPRSPPAVAPKPKKLPANIVLKSHRASASDGHLAPSAVAASDRLLSDPQRIHMEALRKLGLLRSEGTGASPGPSPTVSPKSQRSWVSPPYSPSSPGAPPSAPSYVHGPAAVSAPSAPAAAGLLPAPAAFSDPVTPPPSGARPPAVTGASEAGTPPRSPPALLKELMSPRADADAVGSAHVGRSVGGGRTRGERSDSRRSVRADSQHSGDTQKLPRSHGISVLICPRAENGENRREALKKLGLLRD